MKTLLLFLALPLYAATLLIDSGAPTEQDCSTVPAGSAPCFSGGFAYTVQPADDTTLRYAWAPVGNPIPSFSYSIPAADDVAYIVTLRFLEPSPSPPARVFSVTVNDQLIYPRLTMPGYLIPFARSFVAVASNGFLVIRFDTITRGAIVSRIEVTPLLQPQAVLTSFPAVSEWAVCKSGVVLAGPIGPGVPPGAMWPGLRKITSDIPAQIPTGGYSVLSCDGLEYYRFKLADGTTTPPYVAVRMTDDYLPDPALWVKQ
jgi:hypothetical protein